MLKDSKRANLGPLSGINVGDHLLTYLLGLGIFVLWRRSAQSSLIIPNQPLV